MLSSCQLTLALFLVYQPAESFYWLPGRLVLFDFALTMAVWWRAILWQSNKIEWSRRIGAWGFLMQIRRSVALIYNVVGNKIYSDSQSCQSPVYLCSHHGRWQDLTCHAHAYEWTTTPIPKGTTCRAQFCLSHRGKAICHSWRWYVIVALSFREPVSSDRRSRSVAPLVIFSCKGHWARQDLGYDKEDKLDV